MRNKKDKATKEKSCVSYPEGNQQDSPREGPAQESRKWPVICDFICSKHPQPAGALSTPAEGRMGRGEGSL